MSREQETGFLSRWSRRKLEQDTGTQQDKLQPKDKAPAEVAKSSRETVEQDQELPLWRREDVDAETKKAVLRTLFHKPEFNIRDGLNEYDDDFTQFSGLGAIVTHEMKRMLELAEEKTGSAPSTENRSEPDAVTEHQDADNEDKDLA